MTPTAALVDSYGRRKRDLRVSVTDRCNFRCLYCLPETEAAANFYRAKLGPSYPEQPAHSILRDWMPRSAILSFEEIERVVRLAAGLGIQKIRVTGGEPLVRQCLVLLVARLARVPGVVDLAMTTNGFQFAQKEDRHHIGEPDFKPPARTKSCIGG